MNKKLSGATLGVLFTTALAPAAQAKEAATISGAGATFPYPVYAKWADTYAKETRRQAELPGHRLGRRHQADHGSDGRLRGLRCAPQARGAGQGGPDAVPDRHGRGGAGGQPPLASRPGELKLTPRRLADIFLGKIKKWNDPRISQGQPGREAARRPRSRVVHRSDGSGTTWIFTNYLTKVSPEWAKSVGNDKSVAWPAGVGGKGNQGVASYVQRIKGAIGYVESAYAMQNTWPTPSCRTTTAAFVDPTDESVQAAAKGADWAKAKGFYMVLTDQPGADSWPITRRHVHAVAQDAEGRRGLPARC